VTSALIEYLYGGLVVGKGHGTLRSSKTSSRSTREAVGMEPFAKHRSCMDLPGHTLSPVATSVTGLSSNPFVQSEKDCVMSSTRPRCF